MPQYVLRTLGGAIDAALQIDFPVSLENGIDCFWEERHFHNTNSRGPPAEETSSAVVHFLGVLQFPL